MVSEAEKHRCSSITTNQLMYLYGFRVGYSDHESKEAKYGRSYCPSVFSSCLHSPILLCSSNVCLFYSAKYPLGFPSASFSLLTTSDPCFLHLPVSLLFSRTPHSPNPIASLSLQIPVPSIVDISPSFYDACHLFLFLLDSLRRLSFSNVKAATLDNCSVPK